MLLPDRGEGYSEWGEQYHFNYVRFTKSYKYGIILTSDSRGCSEYLKDYEALKCGAMPKLMGDKNLICTRYY